MTIFEFINHNKVTFPSARSPNFSHFPRQVKYVRFPSIPLQRGARKIFSNFSVTERIVRTRSSIFYYLIDMNIQTRNISVCNSGQYIYITGLGNFFFVLQDLIDRIILIFREQLFTGTCFLLASNTLSQVFPTKIGSLNGNGAA